MSALRRRLRNESGHTLIELLVVMTLAVLVLGIVLLIGQLFMADSTATGKLTQAEDDSRAQMARIVRTIRDAPQPAASTSPIAIARTHDLILAGTSSAGTATWVRYCVGGTNGDALVYGTTARTTSSVTDPGTTCPTSNSGAWSFVTLVAKNLKNVNSLFMYSCTTTCSSAAAVRSVSIRLERGLQTGRSVVLTSAVSPRNLP
jgi:type II secretory pathway pseudopilin PulG